MADPRPVARLLQGQVVAVGALGAWWWLQGPRRLALLLDIAVREQARQVPPLEFLAQADWLWQHRTLRLLALSGLLALALLIGAAEGVRRRRQDVLGGMRLQTWTLGVVGMALVPGLAALYVLQPWPLPGQGVPLALAAYSGVVSFALARGWPTIP